MHLFTVAKRFLCREKFRWVRLATPNNRVFDRQSHSSGKSYFEWSASNIEDDGSRSATWIPPKNLLDRYTGGEHASNRSKMPKYASHSEMGSMTLAEAAKVILDDMKAVNVSHYYRVRKEADNIIIATGLSPVHMRSIADAISQFGKSRKKLHVEGRLEGDWILIDAGQTIVHIFSEDCRLRYDLDGLYNRVDADGNGSNESF